MFSPKKNILNKESSFIIRKTVRPPTAGKLGRMRESPDKKGRDQRKSVMENYSYSPSRTLGPSSLGLTTTCWFIFDSKNGKELGFRQHYQREIASLTKIMTTLIAIETIERWGIRINLLVRITETASKMIGTTANLKHGTWITIRDLLFGAMLPSGNDAAYTLAEVVGYFLAAEQICKDTDVFASVQNIDLTSQSTINYVAEFIRAMNIKAEELQLLNTRFSNPHGLQNAMNVSSARDIAMLSVYASRNRLFSQVMNSEMKRYEYFSDEYKSDKEVKRWYNTNVLLGKGWEGIKTGQTLTAGSCLASLKSGVYVVVLNSVDMDKRFTDTQKLYNWYVEQQSRQVLILDDRLK